MNIKLWIEKTVKKLSYCDNPKYEAELLLMHVTQCSPIDIFILNNIKISDIKLKCLTNLVHRRSLGEPMAYLTGEKEFWSLSLRVSYDTLIPRPDTEILVEKTIEKISNPYSSILDLGTGCGAIALALANTCPTWSITGIDNSKQALKIAKFNALKLKLHNIYFFYSNWFSHIYKKFDIIVSNPPYISINEIKNLKRDILFEPINALFSDKNGFADIELIIKTSFQYLLYNGWLLIEHGWKQKSIIQYLFQKYKFSDIQSYKDYGGNDRVTIGKKVK
ncbi:peptide chain release factor N(5)-glutamine methyltransferase [Buchnera aphidicola]|uniref:peptide chain release factor N(5)-glutamine methyltransferase n=1 Tax=Buchnera aphidicola TaxID=9 RepID=UPI003BEF2E6C